MFGKKNLSSHCNEQHFYQKQVDDSFLFPQKNLMNSPEIARARSYSPESNLKPRPQFMRLDSTGEPVAVLKSDMMNQRMYSSTTNIPPHAKNMFNMLNQGQLGFGHRYVPPPPVWHSPNNRAFSGMRRNNRPTPQQNRYPQKNGYPQQNGYPFYQFAMAGRPADMSAHFFSSRGDSQILNLAQLTNQNFCNSPPRAHSNYSPPRAHCNYSPPRARCNYSPPAHCSYSPPRARCTAKKNIKPHQKMDQSTLCDSIGKMSISPAAPLIHKPMDIASTFQSPTDPMDSGFGDHSDASSSCDTSQLNGALKRQPDTQTADCEHAKTHHPFSVHLNEDTPDVLIPLSISTSSSVSLLVHDSDSDSADSDFSFSDDDDSEDEVDGGAQFELLSCFFPDDPYNPLNFNKSCGVDLEPGRPKRTYSSSNCDKGLSDSSRSSKRVRFVSESQLEEVHKEDSSLAEDYQDARCGPWEDYARQRERFRRRVEEVAPTLNPCLQPLHRQKVYECLYSTQ